MNKTMFILSRGTSALTKKILHDLNTLFYGIKENKYDQKNSLSDLKELMEINDCNSTLYFESTKRIDYMWVAHENGPSARFITYNMFTIRDLVFDTNSSMERGHLLVFDENFYQRDELKMVKDLFEKVFTFKSEKSCEIENIENLNKEEANFDRMICFFYVDNKIWMRVYVVGEELKELGPRCVFELDKVIDSCFTGKIIYKNEERDRNKKMFYNGKENLENDKSNVENKDAEIGKDSHEKEIDEYDQKENIPSKTTDEVNTENINLDFVKEKISKENVKNIKIEEFKDANENPKIGEVMDSVEVSDIKTIEYEMSKKENEGELLKMEENNIEEAQKNNLEINEEKNDHKENKKNLQNIDDKDISKEGEFHKKVEIETNSDVILEENIEKLNGENIVVNQETPKPELKQTPKRKTPMKKPVTPRKPASKIQTPRKAVTPRKKKSDQEIKIEQIKDVNVEKEDDLTSENKKKVTAKKALTPRKKKSDQEINTNQIKNSDIVKEENIEMEMNEVVTPKKAIRRKSSVAPQSTKKSK